MGQQWRKTAVTASQEADTESEAEEELRAEPRWPMAGAVVASMVLTALLPDRVRLGPAWLLPACEALLLLALVAGDPGRITRRSRALRVVAIGLVGLLALSAMGATALLIRALIEGSPTTNEAGPLLQAGVSVFIGNDLAFALLFWELDAGGPISRLWRTRHYTDFAFPQQLNPGIGPPGWQPRFVDYLYLGLTNSVAFSPTDVMPLAPWAKMGMALQSLVSFAVVGLVIARAVNVLN